MSKKLAVASTPNKAINPAVSDLKKNEHKLEQVVHASEETTRKRRR